MARVIRFPDPGALRGLALIFLLLIAGCGWDGSALTW